MMMLRWRLPSSKWWPSRCRLRPHNASQSLWHRAVFSVMYIVTELKVHVLNICRFTGASCHELGFTQRAVPQHNLGSACRCSSYSRRRRCRAKHTRPWMSTWHHSLLPWRAKAERCGRSASRGQAAILKKTVVLLPNALGCMQSLHSICMLLSSAGRQGASWSLALVKGRPNEAFFDKGNFNAGRPSLYMPT